MICEAILLCTPKAELVLKYSTNHCIYIIWPWPVVIDHGGHRLWLTTFWFLFEINFYVTMELHCNAMHPVPWSGCSGPHHSWKLETLHNTWKKSLQAFEGSCKTTLTFRAPETWHHGNCRSYKFLSSFFLLRNIIIGQILRKIFGVGQFCGRFLVTRWHLGGWPLLLFSTAIKVFQAVTDKWWWDRG